KSRKEVKTQEVLSSPIPAKRVRAIHRLKHNVKDSAAPWPQTSMEVPSTSPTARWFSEGELGSKKWPPNVALCE
ncbi:hypothetical protein D6D28_06123, partial [Aureobasidium pullulans]